MSLRKIIKTRAAFPSEQAAMKLLYMALRTITAKWDRTKSWHAAINQFAYSGMIGSEQPRSKVRFTVHMWKLPQRWKSIKDDYDEIFLMISTAA